jgi:hypothetical protein
MLTGSHRPGCTGCPACNESAARILSRQTVAQPAVPRSAVLRTAAAHVSVAQLTAALDEDLSVADPDHHSIVGIYDGAVVYRTQQGRTFSRTFTLTANDVTLATERKEVPPDAVDPLSGYDVALSKLRGAAHAPVVTPDNEAPNGYNIALAARKAGR